MSIITTRTWDYGSRLRSIANAVNGAVVSSRSYNYDAINRRTRATLENNSMWNYGYDDRNELTSASREWSDQSPVSGQQYGYAYDNIGNRQSASYGGDTSGRNLQTINYGANSLNEYTSVATPGWQEVVGAAITSNSVTVNGGAADRKLEYFHRETSSTNGGGPVWQGVAVVSGGATNSGGMIFPANSQAMAYDAAAIQTVGEGPVIPRRRGGFGAAGT